MENEDKEETMRKEGLRGSMERKREEERKETRTQNEERKEETVNMEE